MSFDTPDFDLTAGRRDTAMPRFYMEAHPNPSRSEREGKPCFDDVEMVEIHIPGDRKSVHCAIVNETHRKRWPQHYAAFKAGLEAPVEGTPISELPGITRAQAEELAFAHVKTIEALAGLSDEQLTKTVPMGGYKLRDKATRWIDQTNGAVPMEKLAAENDHLKGTIAEQGKQLADLQAQMTKLLAQSEPKPAK